MCVYIYVYAKLIDISRASLSPVRWMIEWEPNGSYPLSHCFSSGSRAADCSRTYKWRRNKCTTYVLGGIYKIRQRKKVRDLCKRKLKKFWSWVGEFFVFYIFRSKGLVKCIITSNGSLACQSGCINSFSIIHINMNAYIVILNCEWVYNIQCMANDVWGSDTMCDITEMWGGELVIGHANFHSPTWIRLCVYINICICMYVCNIWG